MRGEEWGKNGESFKSTRGRVGIPLVDFGGGGEVGEAEVRSSVCEQPWR